MDPLISIIGVEYDEVSPDSYAGITMRNGKERILFNSGNPAEDALDAMLCSEHPVIGSSSIDHFLMIGGDLGEFFNIEDDADLMSDILIEWARKRKAEGYTRRTLPSRVNT